ncbi:MAG: hypothetical protein ACI9OJ_000712 [Myxococcota bacterium]|jgi:hypothetical protein
MGPVLVMVSCGDPNLTQIVENPPMVARLVEPDDPELYLALVAPSPRSRWSRLLPWRRPAPPPVRYLPLGAGEGRSCDLDRAHLAIHLTLSGMRPGLAGAFLQSGGSELPGVSVGQGPVRVFTSAEVATIATTLASLDRELVRTHLAETDLSDASLPPHVADKSESTGYVMAYYDELVEFVAAAQTLKLGLVLYLT